MFRLDVKLFDRFFVLSFKNKCGRGIPEPFSNQTRNGMAKVVWAPGISTVSGASSKINKKSPHANDQNNG